MESLSIYHRKILKGILHVSKQCPSPAIYFALAEAPIEETIHREVFSFFFNIWINPQTKLFKIISNIWENICESSKTWCLYLRKLCLQYGIEDPSILLKKKPPPKNEFKRDIETRILSFHERELRKRAAEIRRMKYFNCSLLGLSAECHPSIKGIYSTNEVKRSRIHIKMLLGDLYTYEVKSQQLGGSPHCRNCEKQNKTPEI